MGDDLPKPNHLPTLSKWIANWLGFQLPSIPMPQTARNLDKAVGNILLAAGENAEARIKSNTGKAKAKSKIDIQGMYRSEEERRKIENRAAAVKVAVDEMNGNAALEDASSEIDDDWLNVYSRLAEDKTSEELRSLFGKILAGEIRKPGSFSLRTMQFISTLSREEAHGISEFFSFVFSKEVVPIPDDVNMESQPGLQARMLIEELGLSSSPNTVGGLAMTYSMRPRSRVLLLATGFAVVVQNDADRELKFQVGCQILTKPGRELAAIANAPTTPIEYLKTVAQILFEKIRFVSAEDIVVGRIKVTVNRLIPVANGFALGDVLYTASMPGQQAT